MSTSKQITRLAAEIRKGDPLGVKTNYTLYYAPNLCGDPEGVQSLDVNMYCDFLVAMVEVEDMISRMGKMRDLVLSHYRKLSQALDWLEFPEPDIMMGPYTYGMIRFSIEAVVKFGSPTHDKAGILQDTQMISAAVPEGWKTEGF